MHSPRPSHRAAAGVRAHAHERAHMNRDPRTTTARRVGSLRRSAAGTRRTQVYFNELQLRSSVSLRTQSESINSVFPRYLQHLLSLSP